MPLRDSIMAAIGGVGLAGTTFPFHAQPTNEVKIVSAARRGGEPGERERAGGAHAVVDGPAVLADLWRPFDPSGPWVTSSDT